MLVDNNVTNNKGIIVDFLIGMMRVRFRVILAFVSA